MGVVAIMVDAMGMGDAVVSDDQEDGTSMRRNGIAGPFRAGVGPA